MNVRFTRDQKKYLKLVEELKELYLEGYVSETEYPDMAEVNDSLYEYVLIGLGIWKGATDIYCQYSLEDLEKKVKEKRRLKNAKTEA